MQSYAEVCEQIVQDATSMPCKLLCAPLRSKSYSEVLWYTDNADAVLYAGLHVCEIIQFYKYSSSPRSCAFQLARDLSAITTPPTLKLSIEH